MNFASFAIVVLHALAPVSSDGDLRSLLDATDALQAVVEDFQCEYEGKVTVFDPRPRAELKVGADGLLDNYSGIFIWRREGDYNLDALHRMQPGGKIVRDRVVIRAKQNQAEHYTRDNNAPLGYSIIEKPQDVLLRFDRSYAKIFLIEDLKRLAHDEYMRFEVADEFDEGRRVKAVSVFLKDVPEASALAMRFLIDMERSGHVVRLESYGPGKIVRVKTTIRLQEFEVAGSRIWMPVSGVEEGFSFATRTGNIESKSPMYRDEVYVNGGSMEFNRKPGPEAFRIDYKPGTRISDNLSQMQVEFGRQDSGPKKTKRQIEEDLRGQVAAAEKQGKELLASSPARDRDWTPWFVGLFGTVALVTSITLWVQRRRH